MAKAQAHFRLEPELLEAIKTKAEAENITTTELVTRFLKQGLNIDIHIDTQSVNQKTIEDIVYQRVSERITQSISEHQNIAQKTIEDIVYQRVSERITSQFIELENVQNVNQKAIEDSVYQRIPHRIANQFIELEERISNRITEEGKNELRPIDNKDKDCIPENNSVSNNLTLQNEHKRVPDSISSVDTNNKQQITLEEKTLNLFDFLSNEQIMAPGKLSDFLNEIIGSNDWNIHKLKNIRLKQLTWVKNYENLEKKSPLPLVVENYMIDWVISDDDKPTATGKKWWVQKIPDNFSEVENLIEKRKKMYVSHFNLEDKLA